MSTLDHTQASELFSAYWDEELSSEQTAVLEEHLGSCLSCRQEYQEFEQMLGAAATLPQELAPPNFVAGAVKRVHRRSRGRFFRVRRLGERIPYELFSLLMLGLILAVYLMLQLNQPGRLNLP